MGKSIEGVTSSGVGQERGWKTNADGSVSIKLAEAQRRGLKGGADLQRRADQFKPGAQAIITGEGYELRHKATTSQSSNNKGTERHGAVGLLPAAKSNRQRGSCLVPILTVGVVGVVGVVASVFAIRGNGQEHYQFQLPSLTPVKPTLMVNTPLSPQATRTPLTLKEGASGPVISAYQTLKAQGAEVTIVPAGQETPWAIKAK